VILYGDRHHLRKYLFVSLLLSGGGGSPTIAHQIRPLPPEQILKARSFVEYSPIEFSPDGRRLVYTVRVPATEKDAGRTPEDLFLNGVPPTARGADIIAVDVASGEFVTVTGGKGDNWLPTWSPDGHLLAFLSNRGGGYVHLWVWDVASGNLRQVSDVNVWTKKLQWLPDGDRVMLGVLPKGLSPFEFSNVLIHPRITKKQEATSFHATVNVYRSNSDAGSKTEQSPPWNLDGDLRDLAILSVGSGSIRRIDQGHRISDFFLSPDGSRLAYTSPQAFEKPGSQQIVFSIVEISVQSGQVHILAANLELEIGGGSLSWSPDSSKIAYRTGGMEGKGDCYLLNPETGATRNVTSFREQHAGYASQAPLWDARAEYIYFTDGDALWRTSSEQAKPFEVANIPGHRIVRLIADGRGVLWLPKNGVQTIVLAFEKRSKQLGFYEIDMGSFRSTALMTIGQNPFSIALNLFGAVSKDGRQFAYFSQDADRDMDIWLTQADFRSPKRITDINPAFDNYRMGAARLIEWRDLDGNSLQGALMLPSPYQEGERYPLAVWVYGGENGSDSLHQFGFLPGPFNLQLLATRGYAVFFPDAPQHLGTPMADLTKTVLPGVDKVVAMGIADPDRVGIVGHSNGGYSVLSLIVQTQLFRAAIDADGMGDLMGMYGEMNAAGEAFGTSLERAFDGLGGTPWEVRERYIENSPVFYLDRVKTPLLIVHGDQDETVSPFLSDEVFVDLRRLGKEVEYAKYVGEGHSPPLWSYANQLDFCNRMIDWFDKHLKAASPPKNSLPRGSVNQP